MQKKGVSVVICCYNSALRIVPTLTYLSKQKTKDVCYEIIIINNNCTDHTVDIALKTWKEFGNAISLKIVDEPCPGLSFARKKGVENADYDFVIFCDDDNWLDETYIQLSYKIMKENEEIGALGGLGIPFFEDSHKPEWFEKYKIFYAVGEQGNKTEDITFKKNNIYGAGAVFRKSALLSVGLEEQLTTDRLGDIKVSGGDTEICYRLIIKGYQIWYDERLTFYHFIPHERLSLDYVKKIMVDNSATYLLLHGLMYKAGVFPKMFNSKLKRSWLGRITYDLINLKFDTKNKEIDLKTQIISKSRYFKFLLYLNFRYDSFFK